jgi:catalase
MLQARLFSYGDTQRYLLGVNFNHIPVNAPQQCRSGVGTRQLWFCCSHPSRVQAFS